MNLIGHFAEVKITSAAPFSTEGELVEALSEINA
jgi:hypothetical protein